MPNTIIVQGQTFKSELQPPNVIHSTLVVEQGPAGPPGGGGTGPGGGDKNYEHYQAIASDTWLIAHGLDKHPSVTVIDSAGDECEGQTIYVDRNTVALKFSAAFAGTAYLN